MNIFRFNVRLYLGMLLYLLTLENEGGGNLQSSKFYRFLKGLAGAWRVALAIYVGCLGFNDVTVPSCERDGAWKRVKPFKRLS